MSAKVQKGMRGGGGGSIVNNVDEKNKKTYKVHLIHTQS